MTAEAMVEAPRRTVPGPAWLLLALASALILAGSARGGDLEVSVVDLRGRPVPDAVVTAKPEHARAGGPIRFPWPYVMSQRNQQFEPFVLIVPVGASVAFPNRDPFRHQVYSFSPAKTFELKLYGRDASRTVRFERPGVVALGCNIHDNMAAFIRVVDTPYAGKTDRAGRVVLHDLPVGPAVIEVWHPYMKAPPPIETVTVPGSAPLRLRRRLALRPAPFRGAAY